MRNPSSIIVCCVPISMSSLSTAITKNSLVVSGVILAAITMADIVSPIHTIRE